MTRRYYDWHATMSRQTGTNGEICFVIGAKNIGKTFGLRKFCIENFIRSKGQNRFCEICRTKDEKKLVSRGYFDKLQSLGCFPGYVFRTTGDAGYIAKRPKDDEESPDWQLMCYFVALTSFQTEKKRTFANIKRYIFDEAIIDTKDRSHRYMHNEFLILMNLLDTLSRQQPGGPQYYVYLLGNACDLTCPYFRDLHIDRTPKFGYSFWNRKQVLLHYVKPWDQEEMEQRTLVGRALRGNSEADMMYGNRFSSVDTKDVMHKSRTAKYAFAFRYEGHVFALWMDYSSALAWVTSAIPKDAKNIFSLTKEDSTLDFPAIERSNDYFKTVGKLFFDGLLRFETPQIRARFLALLDMMGQR